MICFDSERKLFHLQGEHVSYVMQVDVDSYLHHVYWGKRLEKIPEFLYDRAPYRRASLVEHIPADSPKCSREFFHYECPTYGMGDFRLPGLQAKQESNGVALNEMHYESHSITRGRTAIEGLPCARGGEEDVETLIVVLSDAFNGLKVELHYHLYAKLDVITRHMTVVNAGSDTFHVQQAMSATVDFADGNFEMLTLDGTTLREFTPSVRPLYTGVTEITSTRGTSSHQHNPNIALLRPGTDQMQGEVYGFSLVYSGNFTLRAEVDQYGSCRMQGGINPFTFDWKLESGERFETPEIVLSYSAQGLNGLSSCLHPFVRGYIVPEAFNNTPRPLLLNTWEACYFDVSLNRLIEIGEEAKKCGVELLVLDDGWFGQRNNANSSLGDWTVNEEKFPGGLDVLADALAERDLKLGIWVEPEMISPNSDLYRAHPDWCFHAEGRVRTEWRNQLVLDMGRKEVVDYLIECMDKILASGKISYIKWDHNRRLTQVASEMLPADRQGELFHRYMLGTYRLANHLRTHYPNILLENCASGGGRYDYGMYCYFHQGWLSDNTDGVCRLSMQNAASVFFPSMVITSHVSICPNHQIGRTTPYWFRADVCTLFNAGYEIDPLRLSDEERGEMIKSSAVFKDLRETVQLGKFYRLNRERMPEEWFGWMAVDSKRAVVGYYRAFCKPESGYWTVPLCGLEPNAEYRDTRTGETLTGADWMTIGLRPNWREGDFFSQIFILEKV